MPYSRKTLPEGLLYYIKSKQNFLFVIWGARRGSFPLEAAPAQRKHFRAASILPVWAREEFSRCPRRVQYVAGLECLTVAVAAILSVCFVLVLDRLSSTAATRRSESSSSFFHFTPPCWFLPGTSQHQLTNLGQPHHALPVIISITSKCSSLASSIQQSSTLCRKDYCRFATGAQAE
jgi:hypothetical protein